MGLIRARLEFGMELHANVEIAIGEFHRLHDVPRRRGAAESQTALFEGFFVLVIEFVSVAVALLDEIFAVARVHRGARLDLTEIGRAHV